MELLDLLKKISFHELVVSGFKKLILYSDSIGKTLSKISLSVESFSNPSKDPGAFFSLELKFSFFQIPDLSSNEQLLKKNSQLKFLAEEIIIK